MSAAPDNQPRGPVRQFVESLSGLLATVISIGRTRLELVTVELREELQRAAAVLLWSAVAFLAAAAGTLFAVFAVILVYWDSHRILATVLAAGGFFIVAIGALMVIRARLRARPLFLQATLTELARDEQELRGQQP
ncbi:MAG: phage holin family protein [Gammaproteobacteria bacterium]